jgi:uncharacterized membrane protein
MSLTTIDVIHIVVKAEDEILTASIGPRPVEIVPGPTGRAGVTSGVRPCWFADPAAAEAAYKALVDAEISGQTRIDGVLAVHSDAEGKIHIDKMTDHSTKKGVKWGIVGGIVLGVLFPPSIIASSVALGGLGGVIGKLRNVHHRSEVATELDGSIGANHSGIIALVHATDAAKAQQAMPAATKVTTAEVDEAAAKDISEAAKAAS